MHSWDEYVDKASEWCDGWAFRGHADVTWQLLSTLGRYLNSYVKKEHWSRQEERIIRIFQRKGHLFLTHIPERSDTFQWLALMQHQRITDAPARFYVVTIWGRVLRVGKNDE